MKLHIDKIIDPSLQPYRRVQLPMHEKVVKESNLHEDTDVIKNVHRPTEWISPIVIQTKRGSDDRRVCVDVRLVNKAKAPTIKELRYFFKSI